MDAHSYAIYIRNNHGNIRTRHYNSLFYNSREEDLLIISRKYCKVIQHITNKTLRSEGIASLRPYTNHEGTEDLFAENLHSGQASKANTPNPGK